MLASHYAPAARLRLNAEAARPRHPELADTVRTAAGTLRRTTERLAECEGLDDRFAGAVPYLHGFARVLGAHYHLRAAGAEVVLLGRTVRKLETVYDEIVAGGGASDEEGWFVEPTLVRSSDPRSRLMCEEIFGPVVTVHVYDDADWDETLELADTTSPYGLTGAVFATDRAAVRRASARLRHAAGNFYVNAGERHQRQGRVGAQPDPVGHAPGDQGDLRARDRLSLPLHGGGVGTRRAPFGPGGRP